MTQWPMAKTTIIFVSGIGTVTEYEAYDGNILPGDAVKFQARGIIQVCSVDDADCIGFALITPNMSKTTGALSGGKRSSAFATGDAVKVVKGPVFIMARLAPSQTIVRGQYLQCANSGELSAYECVTDNVCQRVARAEMSVTSVTLFQWILVNVQVM